MARDLVGKGVEDRVLDVPEELADEADEPDDEPFFRAYPVVRFHRCTSRAGCGEPALADVCMVARPLPLSIFFIWKNRGVATILDCMAAWLRAAMLSLVLGAAIAPSGWATPEPAHDGSAPFRRVIVVCDNDYPPYAFLDESGHVQGIVPDQWAAWSRATGIEVELRALPWAECIRAIDAGKADIIDTIFETEERRLRYDFTAAYATIEVPVFIHKSISGISSPSDLRGFRIAVKEGDAAADQLAEAGIRSIALYRSYKDIVDAAAALETRIFCVDKPPAMYYLYRAGLDRDFRIAFTLKEGAFHRAVRKGENFLLGAVVDGFRKLPASAIAAIDRKWLGAPLSSVAYLRRLAPVGVGVAALFLVLGIATAVLRARVKSATAELRAKVGALEASEARTKAFIAALPDLFFVLDRKGNYLEAFSSTPELLAAPPGEIVGRNVDAIIADSGLVAVFKEKLAEAIDRQVMAVIDYELDVPDGRRAFEGRIVPLGRDSALLVARDVTEKQAQEGQLRASLREKEILLKEVHHRVKNNMQVISSLIALQADSYSNEEDRALIEETQSRIRAMARLHELLYGSSDFGTVDAGVYLSSLVSELATSYGSCPFRLECTESIPLSLDAAVPFGLVANELVTNALKYAHPGTGGEVLLIILRTEGSDVVVEVDDHGPGLPPGLDPATARTMGFLLVHSLAGQLRGSISFSGPPGLRAALRFPIDRQPS